jgi:uncharacterized protein YbjT (DUF2867 family)
MRLLVTGSTGDQGRAQVDLALAHGHTVRAAMHRRAPAFPPGVQSAAMDYGDPGSVEAAMAGIDTVFANFASSSFNDGAQLVEAARVVAAAAAEAGVGLIVFNTSQPVRDAPLGFHGHDVRFAMREVLRNGPVPVVTLQPVVFMGNLLQWAYRPIVDEGVFRYPHRPGLEVAWICQHDLAQLMLAAAARPALAGRVFDVGGPEILRGDDVARILAQVTGRPVRFESQPIAKFCEAVRPRLAGLEPARRDFYLAELARIYEWYDDSPFAPFRVDMTGVLRELPVPLTRLADWASRQDWSA